MYYYYRCNWLSLMVPGLHHLAKRHMVAEFDVKCKIDTRIDVSSSDANIREHGLKYLKFRGIFSDFSSIGLISFIFRLFIARNHLMPYSPSSSYVRFSRTDYICSCILEIQCNFYCYAWCFVNRSCCVSYFSWVWPCLWFSKDVGSVGHSFVVPTSYILARRPCVKYILSISTVMRLSV